MSAEQTRGMAQEGAAVDHLLPIDRAFARMVARRAAAGGRAHTELLRHTALLVSAERAMGSSCVDLAAHAGRPSPDLPVAPDTDPLVFPALTAWTEGLLASGVCASADDTRACEALLLLDGTRLYLPRYHRAERRLAQAISSRLVNVPTAQLAASIPLFRRLFPDAGRTMDWQALAAVAALRSPLVFVTGGPGTGKTTVAAKLLALLLAGDATLHIAVAAPTGRAAARLAEAIGAAAVREDLGEAVTRQLPAAGSTLHRLLGYHPVTERFRHHAANPLAHDVLVVDEASMVDVLMMDALFAAAKPSARIIVLGDPDQLASVDTGFVLGDIARAAHGEHGALRHSAGLAEAYALLTGGDASWLDGSTDAMPLQDAVVRLRTSFRFGAQPGIGEVATATQSGDSARALTALRDPSVRDAVLVPGTRSMTTLLEPVRAPLEAYLESATPDAALATLSQFRLLCALRDGETGVTGLNARLERWLQSRGRDVNGWYDHRPVLITANDASTQLFNGDVGATLAVDGVPMVHFPLPDGGFRSLTPSRLPAHETAWAMTVHKSQGSEFDHVLLVLPETDTRLLTRELIYTGITRAKKSVTLSGSAELLEAAIGRGVLRASGLNPLLNAHLPMPAR